MEVKRVITELKSKHSCGLDGISTRILKLCPDNIALILAHIFNLSLSEGVFLKAFKQAKVIPVFKKGSTYDVNNYRPISLLPVMSKVLEKLVYTRLVSFLNRKGFFHEMQFGFRPNHSTSHATTLLIENITEAFEAKQAMVGVFLDLSKAFDSIDHDILQSKLFHYGIRGIPYDWFKSNSTNRQQQVMCQNVLSNVKYINIGVPQGSILGPLLFLIYVNDFPQCITKGKTIMFADDTNLFFTEKCHNSVFKEANQELKLVDNWLLSRGGHKQHYIKSATQQSATIFSTSKSAAQNAQFHFFAF